MRKIYFLLTFIFLSGLCFAQNQVQVILSQPPPNQLKARDLWKGIIINPTKNTLHITLYGTLVSAAEGLVVQGKSRLISLPPGTKRITYDDVTSANVKSIFDRWGKQSGNAPAGDYTIYLLVKAEDGREIGSSSINQNIAEEKTEVITPQLISPVDGSVLDVSQPVLFTWTAKSNNPAARNTYSLKVVEIIGNQSPDDAVKRNPTWYQSNELRTMLLQYPLSAKKLEPGKKYAWTVQIINKEAQAAGETGTMADAFMFTIDKPIVEAETIILQLISPVDGSILNTNQPLLFTWMLPSLKPGTSISYNLKVVEIFGKQSPTEAVRKNPAWFEKNDIRAMMFQYPLSAKRIEKNKKYAWQITAYVKNDEIGESETWSFNYDSEETPEKIIEVKQCDVFKVEFKKTTKGDTISYKLLITNNYKGNLAGNKPGSFRITVKGDSIVSITGGVTEGWKRTPSKFPPGSGGVKWTNNSGDIPNGKTDLGNIIFRDNYSNPIKVVYEWRDNKSHILCRDSVKVSCNIISNGNFVQGNLPGAMPSPGTVQNWARAYGYSPIVNNDPLEGFIEQGYVKLLGNLNNGQAIFQELLQSNKIILGKKYRMSVAVRFISSQNNLDYVKIRAIAFNGSLATSGNHPSPSSNIAIIGRSSKIRDCNDWSVIEFLWTANKDFSKIAINAFTNDNSNATVWIDEVTLCETDENDCEEVQLDSNGNPIIPTGYGVVPPNFSCQPEAEEDEIGRAHV